MIVTMIYPCIMTHLQLVVMLMLTLTMLMWRHGGKILVPRTEVLLVKIVSEMIIIVSCTCTVLLYTVLGGQCHGT